MIKEIKKELCDKAKGLQVCQTEMHALMAAKTIDELYTLYWDNIHFCIRRDFPAVRFFAATRHEARKRHIYVGETSTLKAAGEYKAIFLGNCKSIIHTGNSHYTRLYVRHTSEITVYVSAGNVVVIDLFDNAKAIIKGAGDAKVTVFKMGGGHVEGNSVRVFEKQLNPLKP